MEWKNATAAFGMDIDKANIQHIIRYGAPDSLTSWAQELAGMEIQP